MCTSIRGRSPLPFALIPAFLLASLPYIGIANAFPQEPPPLTAQVLVERHLQAVGELEARRAVRTRVCQGASQVEVKPTGFGQLSGPTAYASEGPKQYLEIALNYKDYPGETITFDGNDVHAARVTPQRRSELGDFLYTYPQVMREGLLGGVLSTAWPLFGENWLSQVTYKGIKKINGKQRHRLDYQVRKGGRDLRIELYFDSKTFRHTSSRYTLTVYTGIRQNPSLRSNTDTDLLAAEQKTELTFEEEFSNFRQVDGLDLPQRWRLRVTTASSGQQFGQRAYVWLWDLSLKEVVHNQPINPEIFKPGNNP